MVITWRADQPPACGEHGPITTGPLPGLDGGIALLIHLRDAHGKNVALALESLAARRLEEALS